MCFIKVNKHASRIIVYLEIRIYDIGYWKIDLMMFENCSNNTRKFSRKTILNAGIQGTIFS